MIKNQHKCIVLFGMLTCFILSCNVVESMQNGIISSNGQKVLNSNEITISQPGQIQSSQAQVLPYQTTGQSLPINQFQQTMWTPSVVQQPTEKQNVTGQQIMTGQTQYIGQSTIGQSLSGQTLAGQYLTGQSLNNQPLIGQPLTSQPLTSQPLASQPLSSQPLIGQFPSGQLNNGTSQLGITQNVAQNQVGIQEQTIQGKRTCLEALQSSTSGGIYENYCVLDLSNTLDFAQNADLITQQFFTRIQSAGIKCVYMDLYNSSVNDAYISKWVGQFRQAGIRVLWNLSGNKTVTDQTITMLGNLENVIGLNLAGTSITDIGINQIVNMLNGNSIDGKPVDIDFINIYRCQVSPTNSAILESKFNENANKWNTMFPNKKSTRRGVIKDVGLSLDKRVNNTMTTDRVQVSNNITNTGATYMPSGITTNTLISGATYQNNENSQILSQSLPQSTNYNTQNYPNSIQKTIPQYNTPQSAYNNTTQLGANINADIIQSVLPQTMGFLNTTH